MQNTLQIASTTVVVGFKALSDPIRIQVLELLREQEMCVCDLYDGQRLAQRAIALMSPNLSFLSTSRPLNPPV